MNLFPLNFRWDRYFSGARVLIGLIALVLGILLPVSHPSIYTVTLWIFVMYGMALIFRPARRDGAFGLLALFADVIFFLIVASQISTRTTWLASIFYLYLLSEAIAFYAFREVLMIVLVCAGFCAIDPNAELNVLQRTIIVAGTLGCAFSVAVSRLREQVRSLAKEAAQLRLDVGAGREEEAQRIANDFHDGPLQNFISFQMRLAILRKLLDRDGDAGMQELEALQNVTTIQIKELRAFIRNMRPLDVEGANLNAQIRLIADNFHKESGVPITFTGSENPAVLGPEANAEVLNMVREALHNIQKHAQATRVALSLDKTGKTLEISIDDNGLGFPFSGSYSLEELDMLRLGPASLKRRARMLNAELVLDSRPGRGAGLKMKIPL